MTHPELEELDVTPLGLSLALTSPRGHAEADCELLLPVRKQIHTEPVCRLSVVHLERAFKLPVDKPTKYIYLLIDSVQIPVPTGHVLKFPSFSQWE